MSHKQIQFQNTKTHHTTNQTPTSNKTKKQRTNTLISKQTHQTQKQQILQPQSTHNTTPKHIFKTTIQHNKSKIFFKTQQFNNKKTDLSYWLPAVLVHQFGDFRMPF